MEDLIIGLQISPTIELTDKNYNCKFKLLVEKIGEIINTDEGTKIGSFNSLGYGYCHVKESKECIEYHIKLAIALKEKVIKYLNNEIKNKNGE